MLLAPLNQRMHTKLLLIDDAVGITGGRNYQDDYYDWDAEYNFRDRDVLVAGPVAREMAANFDAFWNARRSMPVERLNDVGAPAAARKACRRCRRTRSERPQRVAGACRRDAADAALVDERLATQAMPVGEVRYIADLPQKHRRERPPTQRRRCRDRCATLIESARNRKCCCRRLTWCCPTRRRTCSASCTSARRRAAGDRVHQQPGRDRRVHRLRAVVQVQAPLPARVRFPHLRVQAVSRQTRRSTIAATDAQIGTAAGRWRPTRREPALAERLAPSGSIGPSSRIGADMRRETSAPAAAHRVDVPRALPRAALRRPHEPRAAASAPACASACMPSRW